MTLGDLARDRQAEPRAARVRIAGGIQPAEGLERQLHLSVWNARAIVFHRNLHDGPTILQRHTRNTAILDGIVDQVGERTLDGDGPAGEPRLGRPAVGDRASGIRGIIAERFQDGRQVRHARLLLLGVAPQIGEGRSNHRLHFVEVSVDLALRLRILDETCPQAEPSDRRSQVVAHRRQRLGSVRDQPVDAVLHAVEGLGCASHLAGAILGNRLGRAGPADPVRGNREVTQRPCD